MALRDQPYLPLYIQDFMTDEKLNECSAESVGVYIKIMCVLHKQDKYGMFLLKQKDKQNANQTKNFATKLLRYLPYSFECIERSLTELFSEGVLTICDDGFYQKRMVKDNELSDKRSMAGKKGGKNTQFAKAKVKANLQANAEYEIDIINESIKENKEKGVQGEKPEGEKPKASEKKNKIFIPPTIEEIEMYFIENGFSSELARKFYEGYQVAGWHDSKGDKIRSWQQKAQHVWFTDSNRHNSQARFQETRKTKTQITAETLARALARPDYE